ncbi:MAG: polyphosphate kinase 1 [Candidatus Omnitrophica bacterium]|nr:polyphosphate kinase 1 [Candidatus Omnitrophota bacterium]
MKTKLRLSPLQIGQVAEAQPVAASVLRQRKAELAESSMENLNQLREMSVLSFNERVLQEAEDSRNPLMERLKFLGIFSSNMDEFFKVRVASIHRRLEVGHDPLLEILVEEIGNKSRGLDDRFRKAYSNIIKALERKGVRIVSEKEIDTKKRALAEFLDNYFHENVFPSLVPIILGQGQPFPQLTDGQIYFGIAMYGKAVLYSLLQIPPKLPRFINLPNGNIMYLDDLIRYSLDKVFNIFEYERIEAYEMKISRDAQLDIDNDFSESYIKKMERVLNQRKGGRPTRLVYDEAMPPEMLVMFCRELQITADDMLIPGGRYHNMKDLMQFPKLSPDLHYKKQSAAKHRVLDDSTTPIMEVIENQDLLVTYPYQSFDHIIRLLREAAIDPFVDEIKITLYRTAKTSQVVNAILNAARNGKKIFVSIELQARFDEKHNIAIAKKLATEGVRVSYGAPPMKVHSKLILIRRRHQTFACLSTGNFNEDTGRLYVDSAMLTHDSRITTEVARVFDYLEDEKRPALSQRPAFRHLIVSPFRSRKRFLDLIAEETGKGKAGYIFLKVNHLTDTKILSGLRKAADAGVHVDLVVRTTYGLLPHKNIRAISILDRYLEHQRVYIFGQGKDQKVFLGSGDMMERNLLWRVEVGFPVYSELLKKQVVHTMALQILDTYKARTLDKEQSNPYQEKRDPKKRAQETTYNYFLKLFENRKHLSKVRHLKLPIKS